MCRGKREKMDARRPPHHSRPVVAGDVALRQFDVSFERGKRGGGAGAIDFYNLFCPSSSSSFLPLASSCKQQRDVRASRNTKRSVGAVLCGEREPLSCRRGCLERSPPLPLGGRRWSDGSHALLSPLLFPLGELTVDHISALLRMARVGIRPKKSRPIFFLGGGGCSSSNHSELLLTFLPFRQGASD